MRFTVRKKNAYTLIELIVTVAIIALITVGSLVNYFWFDSRQKLIGEARNMLSLVDKVRTSALTLYYPSGCVGLRSYGIRSVNLNGDFRVVASCDSGEVIVEEIKVLITSKLETALVIDFLAQSGNISTKENASVVIVDANNVNSKKTIFIDALVVDNIKIID